MVSIIKLLIGAFSGLFLFSAFAPINFWPGAIVGLAGLFFALKNEGFINRFFAGFICGSTFFLPLLHWSSTYVGSLPWLILGIGQALIFALVGALPMKSNLSGVISFSASFMAVEILRMKFPFGGFGWGRVGFTQVDSLSNLYPFISVTGISLLVALLGSLLIYSKRISLFSILVLVSVFFLPQKIATTGTFSAIAVQGGVDKLGLGFNARALSVLKHHAEETLKFDSQSELVIWPENASDLDPILNKEANRIIENVIRKIKRPLLIGAVESRPTGPLNSSILFNADGEILSRYVKQDLAPFGEYIPLRPISEAISKEAIGVRDFTAGKTWIRHQVNGTVFTSVICFEILDDDHIRNGAKGSEFLVAQTNNATFGKSWQSSQQLQITKARAAELRKSFGVVSTTGFTAQISPNGSIVKKLEPLNAGLLPMEIEKTEGSTPASKLPSYLWLGIALGLILTSRLRVFSR